VPNEDTRQKARSVVRKFWLWRNSLPSGGLRFDPLHVDGWSATAVYNVGDEVTYNGHTYQAQYYIRDQQPSGAYGPWKLIS
jgi:hypothetical protein